MDIFEKANICLERVNQHLHGEPEPKSYLQSDSIKDMKLYDK